MNKLKKYNKFSKGSEISELEKALSANSNPETEGLIPETFEWWRVFDNPEFEKKLKLLFEKWVKIFSRVVH